MLGLAAFELECMMAAEMMAALPAAPDLEAQMAAHPAVPGLEIRKAAGQKESPGAVPSFLPVEETPE